MNLLQILSHIIESDNSLESMNKMEKFFPMLGAIILILLGILELYLTYRYAQNVKKMKYQPPTAPFAIWSGLIIGLFFIAVPIIGLAGGLRNMSRWMSTVGGLLFWIAAVIALIRAERIRKQLKAEHKPLSSSHQVIAIYVIVAAAIISGIVAIF